MIKAFAAGALLALPATVHAQECIPPQQVGDAAVVAAPFLVDAVANACKAHLPATAFLNSGAATFSERLRAEGAPRVESAVKILAMVAGDAVPEIDNKQALLQVLGGLAQGAIAKEIKPESCPGLDGMVKALAPLPTESIALLGSSAATIFAVEQEKEAARRAARAAEAGEKPPEKVPGPAICKNG